MATLPMLFFFGYFDVGRAMIHVLGLGVYVTSFMKDFFCVPRPFVPPVTRLSIGNHHLEYGFPSTHTANSVSVASYILLLLLSSPVADTPHIFYPSCFLLAFYTFSIVFGRVYCGMHSFTDCTVGAIVGLAITAFWWTVGPTLEAFVISFDWRSPIIVAGLWMLVINRHPQPVDDCPCFEDAIAFVSVEAGLLLSLWHGRYYGFDLSTDFYKLHMPGASASGIESYSIWGIFVLLKIVLGVCAVFAWRLVAKPTLQILLPPLFRFLAKGLHLPNRRWYTPATEYGSVPLDHLGGGMGGLRAIPSVIDLPSTAVTVGDNDATGLNALDGGLAVRRWMATEGLKRRRGESEDSEALESLPVEKEESANVRVQEPGEIEEDPDVRHYDADVLTRAVVYCGIGMLVQEFIPVGFELVGWGL